MWSDVTLQTWKLPFHFSFPNYRGVVGPYPIRNNIQLVILPRASPFPMHLAAAALSLYRLRHISSNRVA